MKDVYKGIEGIHTENYTLHEFVAKKNKLNMSIMCFKIKSVYRRGNEKPEIKRKIITINEN